jgi:hypothetical protein
MFQELIRLRPSLAALLAAVLLATALVGLGAACGRGDDEAAIEERLDDEGTMDVLEKAGEAEYDPPADGELTAKQMEMYIAVQERAGKIRQVANKRLEEKKAEGEAEGKELGFFDAMKAVGDVGDLVTADLRAAQELGHNTAEYQWVQEKVVEAQMARMTREMSKAAGAMGQQFLGVLEGQLAATEEPAQKAEIQRQIDEYEASLAETREAGGEEWGPGVEHNAELVQKYEAQIQRVQKMALGDTGEEAGS